MAEYSVAVCYSARQDNTIQYTEIQYITVTHIIHNNTNNIQYSRQHSKQISKTEKIKNTLYTIKTQKRMERKVNESVFKTTRYTKQ
jgi:hypothetical protein